MKKMYIVRNSIKELYCGNDYLKAKNLFKMYLASTKKKEIEFLCVENFYCRYVFTYNQGIKK